MKGGKINKRKVKAAGQSSFVYVIGKTCRCVTNEQLQKKLIIAQLNRTIFVTLRYKQLDEGC